VPFADPPPWAAWAHQDARAGFEVVYFQPVSGGQRITGCTTAVEDGQPWIVDYEIHVDAGWRTRHATISSRRSSGTHKLTLDTAGDGRWRVNGRPAPNLDGCWDVDLESSAMTNALPVHRLGLEQGEKAAAPSVYVRAGTLSLDRLEQSYSRTEDRAGKQRYDYTAPAFDFGCELVFDEFGLVLAYPGIAVRAG
jgi:hypothetical protein